MNISKKITVLAACGMAFLAQPVMSESIVVTPDVSHAQFVDAVSRDLDRQLARLDPWPNTLSGEGIAIVRFQRNEEGQPHAVELYRESGTRRLDKVAIRAVSKLDSLAIVPSGLEGGQIYQANIIFASSQSRGKKLAAQLAAEETMRMASAPEERAVFAFSIAQAAPAS